MKRIKLDQTCGACPEQYDVYIDGEDDPSGYMRLRHGHFRAEYLGETVFTGDPRGDGCFEFGERDEWLNKACHAILLAHDNRTPPDDLLFDMD
jgi:hypothetical protein